MLQTSSTLTANLTTGVLTPSDPISARASLALTLSGIGSLSASNMRAALYRLSRNGIDGDLVGTCNAFTLSGSTFVGTMSLNTTELVAAYTNLPSVREYETLRFHLLVWDTTATVYTLWDYLDVAYEYALTSDASSVSPISTTTETWGNLKLSGGVIHLYNITTGKYCELRAEGEDDVQHMLLGDGEVL